MSSIIKVDQIQLADGSTPSAGDLGITGTGKVLQVVDNIVTTPISANANHSSNGVVVLATAITPSNASSSIVLSGSVNIGLQDGSAAVRIFRNDGSGDVAIAHATSTSNRVAAWWSGEHSSLYTSFSIPISFVDSPNTTNEVTYKVTISNWRATTIYCNRTVNDRDNADGYDGRAVSTLNLMEIAG